MYYHVIIKSRNKIHPEHATDLTKEQLISRFVEPYERGNAIFIQGTTIQSQDIERINFFRSDLLIEKYLEVINWEDRDSPVMIIGGDSVYVRAISRTEKVTEEFISGPPGQAAMTQLTPPVIDAGLERTAVFIVHGHDGAAKSEVARFVEKLGLQAIILHEQASSGRTIIEKIERHAANAGFGIVIYTPDDVGNVKGKPQEIQGRARQNVVFEHGFLIGKFGRERVVALVEQPIELPGDMSGVVYVNLDEASAWKYTIAKEMKAAGYAIDMNKL